MRSNNESAFPETQHDSILQINFRSKAIFT